MARCCKKAKDYKRIHDSEAARATREEWKAKIKSPFTDEEERYELIAKLNKAPRNESKIRVRSRCRMCGRSRSIYKKFGLCRIHLREMFVKGLIPGLKKASW